MKISTISLLILLLHIAIIDAQVYDEKFQIQE